MPDDHAEERTALYYINRRIDSLELNLKEQMDSHFASLDKKLDAHLTCCVDSRSKFNARVSSLELSRSWGIGVIAFVVFLIGIWRGGA